MRGLFLVALLGSALGGCGLPTSGLWGATTDAGAGAPAPATDSGVFGSSPSDAAMADATAASRDAASSVDASSGANDAGAADDAADAGGDDASTADDAGAPDAGADGATNPTCVPKYDGGPITTVKAWPGTQPPTIDGDLSEWACKNWVHLSATNAAYVSDGATPLSANIAVAWDTENVYFAMRVTDPSVGVGGYNPTNPSLNASAEVYVSGDAVLAGNYDSTTHHYITDFRAVTVDDGPAANGGAPDTKHAKYTAAAKIVPGGWDFEAAAGVQALLGSGANPFTSSMNVYLDFEVNSGNGTAQLAALVLSLEADPACSCSQDCCCGAPTDLPYCDSAQLAWATLD